MKITTNNHWRNFLYGYELTDKERAEFDYLSDDEINSGEFVRYKRHVIPLSEFMRIDEPIAPHPQREGWEKWHGYVADSAVSATLIRISDDNEQYQIAEYWA